MFSAFSADLKWRIVTLGSLIHSPPLLGWNTKGLVGADQHLGFVSLEDQDSLRFQYTETLGKVLGDILPPFTGEHSVHCPHPASHVGPGQMRRIEHDQAQSGVPKG